MMAGAMDAEWVAKWVEQLELKKAVLKDLKEVAEKVD